MKLDPILASLLATIGMDPLVVAASADTSGQVDLLSVAGDACRAAVPGIRSLDIHVDEAGLSVALMIANMAGRGYVEVNSYEITSPAPGEPRYTYTVRLEHGVLTSQTTTLVATADQSGKHPVGCMMIGRSHIDTDAFLALVDAGDAEAAYAMLRPDGLSPQMDAAYIESIRRKRPVLRDGTLIVGTGGGVPCNSLDTDELTMSMRGRTIGSLATVPACIAGLTVYGVSDSKDLQLFVPFDMQHVEPMRMAA